jgi:iron complex transport system substrate-binding protein
MLLRLLVVLALGFGSVAGASGASPLPRIVSLMPSLTEDLFAIGAGPQVVGVSAFTDYPAAAAKLPPVASFASLDAERIVGLHPDIVVGIPAQQALVGDLRRTGLRVELLPDDSYDDLFATLARLGTLSGHPAGARALAASLRARTAALAREVPAGPRPRVFVVLGLAPIFTVGRRSFIARLVSLAGGSDAADVPEAYVRFSEEALLAAQPDAIVADRAAHLDSALGREPWSALRAVRAGRVYELDDADVLERPGPRYVEGLAWLIAHLHSSGARGRAPQATGARAAHA